MQILFTTNDIYYSKLFRFLYREPSSHVGLGFFIDGKRKVIDCTKPEGKEHTLEGWLNKYRITHKMDLIIPEPQERLWYNAAKDYSVGKPYDFSAYYGGMVWGVIHRITHLPHPKRNFLERPEHGLCTEILHTLKCPLLEYGIDIRHLQLAANTPHMICLELYKQSKCHPKVKWYGVF